MVELNNNQSDIKNSEELKASIEKYKVLFDFYKSEADAQRNEYFKYEDKASKYLTALTILSTILLFVMKDVIFQLTFDLFSFVIFSAFAFTSISFAASWRFIFMVLKTQGIKSFPYDNENIEYFDNNNLDVFYYSMSKQYVEVIESYKTAILEKANYLERAFREIKVSGLLLVFLLTLIFIDKVF
ncbi:hypothetical protein [Acinetobacter haemolyticus]|uniref:hypothetical protein n=1 Tax=Acinetobacter haemolyticus TaxID=29430 RepID=UPI00325BC83E